MTARAGFLHPIYVLLDIYSAALAPDTENVSLMLEESLTSDMSHKPAETKRLSVVDLRNWSGFAPSVFSSCIVSIIQSKRLRHSVYG